MRQFLNGGLRCALLNTCIEIALMNTFILSNTKCAWKPTAAKNNRTENIMFSVFLFNLQCDYLS